MSTERNDVVTVCGWCPELHILKFDRRPDDLVVITQLHGKTIITRNEERMTVSHALCESCLEKEMARSHS